MSSSLTQRETRMRKNTVEVTHCEVSVDLSAAAELEKTAFPVSTTFTVTSTMSEMMVDCAGSVEAVTVDEKAAQWNHVEERLTIFGLTPGKQQRITVQAQCEYSRSGEGLHRYQDPEDGRMYLYTQFEPTDAHRAWPCCDQPDIKPQWTFHVTAPQGWIVLSNGEVTDEDLSKTGQCRYSFAQTQPLSSYLTALVAGEYHVHDGGLWEGRGGSTALKLLCRQALAPYLDADDILTVTRQGLAYFEDAYDCAYPWGKYDQIFVPEYNLGAMENPGCVTFTEHYLSTDTPSQSLKQRRANTILHEMSHMWFGDLVTPQWWDDLWLKESFAEHQGAAAATAVTKYKGQWPSFAISRKAWAYSQDLLPTTHPISADIPDVDAAKNNFDGITYAKGAAVLKQLVAWVGHENFTAGIRRYFEEYAYGSATRDDLLKILSDTCGFDMQSWAQAWLNTAGANVFTHSYDIDDAGRILNFTLHQQCATHSDGRAIDSNQLRPHQITVSVWELSDSRLVPWMDFPVRIEGESAPIDPQGVLAVDGAATRLALIVVNSTDDTYAISRLDEAGVRTAFTCVSTCEDSLTRAVVWSSLWNAVRDGICDPMAYGEAVLEQALQETDIAIAERLLTTCEIAISRYLPGSQREQAALQSLDRVADTLRSASLKDPHHVAAWQRLYLGLASVCPSEAVASQPLLVALMQGYESERSEITWLARTVGAGHGLVNKEQLDEWLAENPSGEASVWHQRSVAALPDVELRRHLWQKVRAGEYSNEMLSATLTGRRYSQHEEKIDVLALLDEVEQFWESHTIGMGIRMVAGAIPLDPEEVAPELIAQWLALHAEASPALRRLILEQWDELNRTRSIQGGR